MLERTNKHDFKNYKTGRTNVEFVEYIKAKFPNKKVLDFELKKNDENPYEGILHLDCTFQSCWERQSNYLQRWLFI